MIEWNRERKLRGYWLALAALLFSSSFMSNAMAARSPCVGTFSNLAINPVGGEFSGMEVRVVQTDIGFRGTVQIAQGGAGILLLVDLECDGKEVSFHLPATNTDMHGKFTGLVNSENLKGEIAYDDKRVARVFLQRRKSYWD
ncbi:hypothetical protein [Undibacterium terreum]|uniref:Uncharacterized protein n=1 Tax=Undibacterium terreum TaxID=1224302 RepID=A0A916XPJ3_9BURK|nr:hypothetical protein [Undibacterium terreum]GGC92597.1 hypothetical protein GCM10011396_44860 [Undibacterium terreum]